MKNLYKHSLNINKAQTMVDITNIIEEDIRSSNVRIFVSSMDPEIELFM